VCKLIHDQGHKAHRHKSNVALYASDRSTNINECGTIYASLICGVYCIPNPVCLAMKANIFLLSSLVGRFICIGSIGKIRYLALRHVDIWLDKSYKVNDDDVVHLYLCCGICHNECKYCKGFD
jgi:hypothetical protein